ncbi:VOC family protein [Membranicola marinus]|uniref:VOC family protein n=2 Tax=Membranihabitans marinus TaxID=1227546 RepID=A0A953HZP9_9BACT|nr:VOC family protein [Membranihabitans marinus]MBY5959686.1 VOC family protein [Membranihabitans marinus]
MSKVVWFEIYVEDMDRAQQFYETVLGVELKDMTDPTENDGPSMVMRGFPGDMEGYGAGGALVKMAGFESGKNSTLVYFGSQNCTTEENRVVDAGGKIVQSKMAIGKHGFVTLCTDTEGNMFGLHSME